MYQFGCGISKMGVLNSKIFGQESTSVHQKLGIIVESKVVQKLSLENNVFLSKNGLLNWYS